MTKEQQIRTIKIKLSKIEERFTSMIMNEDIPKEWGHVELDQALDNLTYYMNFRRMGTERTIKYDDWAQEKMRLLIAGFTPLTYKQARMGTRKSSEVYN